jgi:hypothetical protein
VKNTIWKPCFQSIETFEGTQLKLTGWGKVDDNARSALLLSADLKGKPVHSCQFSGLEVSDQNFFL